MTEKSPHSMENTHIDVDVFGCREIDLAPVDKPKRRRQLDEYDYNDPFFEPVEGELDAVEIECKLENFFVYKGEMNDNPKNIARKFNRELKKKEFQQSILNEDKKSDAEDNLIFSFEKMLGKGGANAKYKKEPAFLNRLFWLFYAYSKHLREILHGPENGVTVELEKNDGMGADNQEPKMKSDIIAPKEQLSNDKEDQTLIHYFFTMLSITADDDYAASLVLSKHESGKFPAPELGLREENKKSFLEKRKEEIEELYKGILERITDESRYDSSGKTYKDFKDDRATMLFIKFYLIYIMYYTVANDRTINLSANLVSDYLSTSFPAICTNNTKLKYYVRRVIDMMMAEEGYNPEDVIEGCINGEGAPATKENDTANSKAENTEQEMETIFSNGATHTSAASSVTSLDLLTDSKSVNNEIFKSSL